MSSFTDPLVVEKLSNGNWKTARSFRYYIGAENSDDFVDVPDGFETDFASVPWGVRNFFPKDGPWTQAAVLHDYIYLNHTYLRKKCDLVFLEAMGVLKVPWIKRRIMYRAVRLFGWLAY